MRGIIYNQQCSVGGFETDILSQEDRMMDNEIRSVIVSIFYVLTIQLKKHITLNCYRFFVNLSP